MTPRISPWLIAVLVVELLLAGLFFAFGWSLTASLAQGRTPTPPLEDILLLASPVLAVAVCAGLAFLAWRGQKQGVAWIIALLPLPLSFVLFGMLGAI